MKTNVTFEINGQKINMQIEATPMELAQVSKMYREETKQWFKLLNENREEAYDAAQWLLEKAADFTKKFRVKEKEVTEFTKKLKEFK